MAIDKIKLRALAKDKDERLFAEGDMLDAKNITVSTEGESTSGVVKNVKSTVPGTAATSADQIPSEAARVIGSVSDHSRGKVYFFVWSTTASNHGIYQYDTATDTYKVVLKTSVFDFQQYGFVKADLINGDFQKDGSNQTIIYFTDNHNAPRKINADRAIAGDFSEYDTGEIEHAISAIKAPNLFPPTVELVTDASRSTNNLYGSVLQFAIQYVYKDGERSVLSPHSKVVYPKYMALQGVVDNDPNLADGFSAENLAKVNTRWLNTTPSLFDYEKEVSKIRILARDKNTNPFFIVDEFDPNSNLIRNDRTIYDKNTGIYDFFNDGLYLFESSEVTDKVFDDVPQKATGQAIAGNRLMYSSVNAGYDNYAARADIAVTYEAEPAVAFASQDNESVDILHASEISQSNTGKIRLDFSDLSETIPANTTITVGFDYKPTNFSNWGYYDQSGAGQTNDVDNPLYSLTFDLDGTPTALEVGQAEDSQNIGAYNEIGTAASPGDARGAMVVQFDAGGIDYKRYSVQVSIEEEITRANALIKIRAAIEDEINTYKYFHSSDYITWALRDTDGDIAYILQSKQLDFDVVFDGTVDGTDIDLTPKMWNFELPLGELHDGTTASSFTSSDAKLWLYDDVGTIQQSNVQAGSLTSFFKYTYFNSSVGPKLDIHGVPLSNDVGSKFDNYDHDDDTQINGGKGFSYLSRQSFARRSFKAGSNHKFGVVYFDEYGRPGYVNELGDTYVKPFGDSVRSSKHGPCTISITFENDAPDWAKSYQIVYSDMGSWESFTTFVVGGGFFKKTEVDDETNPTPAEPKLVTERDKLYLSLNTLVKYQVDKGALKNYVYTPGDKLRIISFRDTTGASDNTYFADSDKFIFDVVGIETLTSHIDESTDESTTGVHTNRRGRFLVVSPPQGQYPTNFDPDKPNSEGNFWDHECVVEILTPRKTPPTEIFYEIGESRQVLGTRQLTSGSNENHNDGDPIEITEGSVYYGTRSVVTPNVYTNNDFFSTTNIEDFDYDVRPLESMDASDFIESRCWSRGRAHVKYDDAANIDYPNRIVYSSEFNDPLGNITFNQFNPGSLSFKDLPRNFGAVNYINEYNQNLVALQENKLSLVPVSRNVIEYADGASAITANKSVLGTHKEANGDFGVGSDQSSVFVRDGMVFFSDRSRQKILMAAGANMVAISDVEMSSFFEDEFNAEALADGSGGRVITGYDPEDNILFVTVESKADSGSDAYSGTTVGYSISDKRWISRYDFQPSNYATIDNKMLSGFKYDDTTHYLFNSHSGTTRNQFYGTSYPSSVKVVSKLSPSQPKVFNALSYEGNSGLWTVADEGVKTNLDQDSKGAVVFTEKEGSYYAQFPKVKADNYVYIGEGASNDGATITLSNMPRINRLGVRAVGLLVFWESEGNYNQISSSPAINSYSQADGTITIGLAPGAQDFVGKDIYVKIDNDEDSMRGHWAEIELSNSSTSAHELYCVNTHITPSKLHHPLGQQ